MSPLPAYWKGHHLTFCSALIHVAHSSWAYGVLSPLAFVSIRTVQFMAATDPLPAQLILLQKSSANHCQRLYHLYKISEHITRKTTKALMAASSRMNKRLVPTTAHTLIMLLWRKTQYFFLSLKVVRGFMLIPMNTFPWSPSGFGSVSYVI